MNRKEQAKQAKRIREEVRNRDYNEGTACQEKQKSSVEREIWEIGENLEALHNYISQLEAKLEPILLNQNPDENEKELLERGNCILSKELFNKNSSLSQANYRLSELIDRVDL